MLRADRSPLYLFLIVTSVTPAASATSLWVFSSPSRVQETYRAAAARPMGSLPAEILACSAFFRISRALLLVFSVSSARDAIRETHLLGATTGILMSISLRSSL